MVIERVVHQLEGGPHRWPIGAQGRLLGLSGAAHQGRGFAGGVEQNGRFLTNDRKITVFCHRGVFGVDQLLDLAFRSEERRVGKEWRCRVPASAWREETRTRGGRWP